MTRQHWIMDELPAARLPLPKSQCVIALSRGDASFTASSNGKVSVHTMLSHEWFM